jgi:hypothetical protein
MMVLIQTKVIIHALLVWEMEEWICKCKKKVLMAKEGDKNTSYFHKQAEARKQFKTVTEIQVQNQTITDLKALKQLQLKPSKTLYRNAKD